MATRPIRVAHVIQNLNYGGMERVLHSLACCLPESGFEVHVVVLQYLGRFAEGLGDRVQLHQVPPMSRLSLLHPRPLVEVFRNLAPDIVHSHTGVWLKSVRAARASGVGAVVHTEHGRLDPVPLADRVIDNIASRGTDAIIAVSEPLAGLLGRQVVHDPARIVVIPNGIDLPPTPGPAERMLLRTKLGLPADTPIIGSIGRLEPVKNYRLALRALARVPPTRAGPMPRLVIAGDGAERSALESLAAELGVADRVILLGWRDDTQRLYPGFDLFTLTSTSEGTSISLLEAMSHGITPVVTDVGGNRNVLGPELESLLVRSDDAAGLAALWSRLLEEPESRATAGARASARVRAHFSLAAMVGRHIQLYTSLLPPRPPTGGDR